MHIYPISRLFNKPAGKWLSMLREIEKGREVMLAQYLPLRAAAVAEMKKAGSGAALLDKLLAGRKDTPQQRSIDATSRATFVTFRDVLRPTLGELDESYVERTYRPSPVHFEGFRLSGRFHFSTRLESGDFKLVHLHPSSWDADETHAYIELLTILAEVRHKANRDDVLFLDLQAAQSVPPAKSNKRLRRDLRAVMDLLQRLENTLASEDGDPS